jgi:predicted nucleic acid-binding protein
LTIIIDTDVLIEISDKNSVKGNQIYQKIISSKENIAITSITLYETLYGLLKSKKPIEYLLSFPVYDFSKEDAQNAAKFEIEVEKKGKKIKRTDIMIASTATTIGATLCTFDNDFKELEDLGLRLFI